MLPMVVGRPLFNPKQCQTLTALILLILHDYFRWYNADLAGTNAATLGRVSSRLT